MGLAEPLSGRELAAFVTAVETGSVQGAADALDLTQSAATKRIQSLERRLGQGLLERRADGVRPTPAGRMLYPVAREALAALQRAEATVASSAITPLLRLQASLTVGETLLPQWLAAFREVAPEVRVSVEVTNSAHVSQAVRDGEAEIGFVEGLDTTMAGLRDLTVADDQLKAVVAAGHPWAKRDLVPLSALSRERYMAREPGSGTRAVADSALAAVGVKLVPALEVSSAEGLKRAVLSDGFALLSERTIELELATGALVARPVAGVELRRSFRAVRRTRPRLEGPAARFWPWLEAAVAARGSE